MHELFTALLLLVVSDHIARADYLNTACYISACNCPDSDLFQQNLDFCLVHGLAPEGCQNEDYCTTSDKCSGSFCAMRPSSSPTISPTYIQTVDLSLIPGMRRRMTTTITVVLVLVILACLVFLIFYGSNRILFMTSSTSHTIRNDIEEIKTENADHAIELIISPIREFSKMPHSTSPRITLNPLTLRITEIDRKQRLWNNTPRSYDLVAIDSPPTSPDKSSRASSDDDDNHEY
jgi:hypothetical protein